MAATFRFKVYTDEKEYIASVKDPETGGAIIASIGSPGWTIREGHDWIVWKEGSELVEAGESYDTVARTVYTRVARIPVLLAHKAKGYRISKDLSGPDV